jgi:hypothetical protein
MNDPTGVQSALGIEAVELFSEGGDQLTVRVTGRWRRRRPAWSGQPMLLLDAAGSRHRFPAMPEPPSLSGAVPGTWRMSFSVPASLAQELGGRTWLQFGAVVVPLPVAVEPSGLAGADALGAAPDPAPSQPEPRGETGGLSTALAERERARRAAEQRAHAEQALRLDLEQELAAREQESALAREALGELAAAEERVRELEQKLEPLRRRVDEAEQLAAAASAARERAEHRARELSQPVEADPLPPDPPSPVEVAPAEARSLSLERNLIARRAAGAVRRPSEPRQTGVHAEPAAGADQLGPTIEALRRELQARGSAEARLRAQIVMAQGRLEARAGIESTLAKTLAQLRDELDGLRSALERERAAREGAERRAAELADELTDQRQRSEHAYEAIEDLRGAFAELRALQAASEPTPASAGPVEPERLSEAFSRLRASTGPTGGEGAHAAWLAPLFAALARNDAASAGRLLLDLLPAQWAAYPHPVAYDLVLGEAPGVVQVTVRDGPPEISHSDSARQLAAVDFRVVGSPASIARRLTAKGLRRRFGRRVARVRGNRDALGALAALVHAPLHLGELYASGVRMAPPMALTLVSLMIDPAWTAGQRFTIAHVDGEASAYLSVNDGRPPTVTAAAPAEPATTTIVCAADSLLLVLAGGRPDELAIRGGEHPLALLLKWVQRAQSG